MHMMHNTNHASSLSGSLVKDDIEMHMMHNAHHASSLVKEVIFFVKFCIFFSFCVFCIKMIRNLRIRKKKCVTETDLEVIPILIIFSTSLMNKTALVNKSFTSE